MAKIIGKPKLDIRLHFTVDESEARALDALAGYGDDAFIEAFYGKLGEAYMRDYEDGLRAFLSSIRSVVGPALSKVDAARKALENV